MATLTYHTPESTKWPIIGSIALFVMAIGAVNWIHGHLFGAFLVAAGFLTLAYQLTGWFSEVIAENKKMHSGPKFMRLSFRYGMFWFIFTEFMFFAVFFAALFYSRLIAINELGEVGSPTHLLLWPNFSAAWPVMTTPDPDIYSGPKEYLNAWHTPLLSTIALFLSDMALTWGYYGIRKGNHHRLRIGIAITMLLTLVFLGLQVYEYGNAYRELGLSLSAGIYGTTFFSLTGVHSLHVLVGLVMLVVLMKRALGRDFGKERHFAVTATTWYWHFLDALWIMVFVFVYVL